LFNTNIVIIIINWWYKIT